MRYYLYRATEEVTPSLLGNNRTVDLPGGDVGVSGNVNINEAFIVT